MNGIRWFLVRRFERFSLSTVIVGVVSIILMLMLFWLLKTKLDTDAIEVHKSLPNKIKVLPSQTDPAKTIIKNAPQIPQLGGVITIMFELAKKHGISLDQIAYQDIHRNKEPLLNYAIDFSVSQRYPELKAFMFDLLSSVPYLALEKVSFERDDINDQAVKADFRFKLFLGVSNE